MWSCRIRLGLATKQLKDNNASFMLLNRHKRWEIHHSITSTIFPVMTPSPKLLFRKCLLNLFKLNLLFYFKISICTDLYKYCTLLLFLYSKCYIPSLFPQCYKSIPDRSNDFNVNIKTGA